MAEFSPGIHLITVWKLNRIIGNLSDSFQQPGKINAALTNIEASRACHTGHIRVIDRWNPGWSVTEMDEAKFILGNLLQHILGDSRPMGVQAVDHESQIGTASLPLVCKKGRRARALCGVLNLFLCGDLV